VALVGRLMPQFLGILLHSMKGLHRVSELAGVRYGKCGMGWPMTTTLLLLSGHGGEITKGQGLC
jgi:hypothetical protein